MNRFLRHFGVALAFATGVCLTTFAADEKGSSGPSEPPSKVDWSGYASAGEISGTVVKADDKGVLVRLTRLVPQGGGGGGRNARPQSPKQVSEDIQLSYSDPGMVRWKKLPPKIKDDGTKGTFSPNEQAKLRLPYGAPGYYADRTALQPGHIVQLVLVRPKDIPASKATTSDFAIKYAVIWGEAQTVPSEKK